MDQPLRKMSLTTLTDNCTREIGKYRHKEPYNDQFCLEIFRRAMMQQEDGAWTVLINHFSENVRLWMWRHPYRQAALRYEAEQSYIDEAFRRFWQAVNNREQMFLTLASALKFLHLCLNSAIMDTLRTFARPKEESMSAYDYGGLDEPASEDQYNEDDLWEVIKELLPSERERRVAYLLFPCNLKPREIVRYCSDEFASEEEIYRLKRNIVDRISRNIDKIRWKLNGDN